MDAPDPWIGRVLAERYEIIRRLGEGGMGAVYQARQIAMDRMVALKLIHPHLAGTDAAAQRFHREMQTTSKVEHPNTIQVFDYGKTDEGQLFLAVEFLPGRTLTQVLEESGAMPVARVAAIMGQVGKALVAAHHEGIVHRDLKPDNVMLLDRYGEKDFVKVLDFGIARFCDDQQRTNLTSDGGVIGTPAYMSPEQAQGRPVDLRSDLYTFGVILYQMATGLLPFSGATPVSMLVAHASEIPKPPSQVVPGLVPAPLEALIMQLLAKAPEDRCQSAGEVVQQLEACVGGGIAVRPPGGVVPPTRVHERAPRSKSPVKWILAGAGVAGLAAVAVLALPGLTRKGGGGATDGGGAVDQGPLARARLDRFLAADGDPPAPAECRTSDGKTLELLARAAAVRGQPAEALALLDPAAATAGGAAEFHALRAQALLAEGKAEEALAVATKARELCARYALAHNIAGNASQKLRRHDDAALAYDAAIRDAPDYGAPRFNRGLLHLRKKDLVAAIAAFDEVIKRNADHPNARMMRGQAHLLAGHTDDAIADLEEASRRDPANQEAAQLLAQARKR
ncbi:MAG: serine/threonine-protein kinase [Myxococcales bacterium]|nr:serine/threonine-protein kinase [Myxococcales bacterium]